MASVPDLEAMRDALLAARFAGVRTVEHDGKRVTHASDGEMAAALAVAAPAGGVTSGDGVVIGALFGVASKTAAAGETVTLATDGVFDLPKIASAVVGAGAKVSWGDAAKQVNAPGKGRYPIGTAIDAAGNGAATVRVRLDGIATVAA